MYLIALIVFSKILGPSLSFAQEESSFHRLPSSHIIVEIGNSSIETRRIYGRTWSEESLRLENMQSSFNEWQRCYENRDGEGCYCEETRITSSPLVDLSEAFRDKCAPLPSDIPFLFSANFPFKEARDNKICDCYQNGDPGPMASLIQRLYERSSRDIQADADSFRQDVRNRALQLVSQFMTTARFQAGLHAASYADSKNDLAALSGAYSSERENGALSRSGAGRTSGRMHTHSSHNNRTPAAVARREFTNSDFTSEDVITQNGFCIPYMKFLSSKQFPSEIDFYNDLGAISNYREEDWNYSEVLKELKRRVGEQTLSAAIENDRTGNVRQIFARAKFLYDNPLVRNIFMSKGAEKFRNVRRDLFNEIKRFPRPDCCSSSAEWAAKINESRESMTRFLRNEGSQNQENDVARALQHGLDESFKHTEQIASYAARDMSASSDARINVSLGGTVLDWKGFCEERVVVQRQARKPEVAFAFEFESLIGRRNFESPLQDEEYASINQSICKEPRTNGKETLTFDKYLQRECPANSTDSKCTIENRAELAGRFIRDYENPVNGKDSAEVLAVRRIIEPGMVKQPEIYDVDEIVVTARRVSDDPKLARSSWSTVAKSSGMELPSGAELSKTGSPVVPMAQAASSTSAPSQNFDINQSLPLQAQGFGGQIPMPIPTVAATQGVPSETTRFETQLSEGESIAQQIRRDIGEIQNLRRENGSASQSQPLALSADLNEKLSNLERKLREQESANLALRERIAETQRVEQTRRPDDDDSPARRIASVASSSVSAPQTGGFNGGGDFAPQVQGASLGGARQGSTERSANARTGLGNSALIPRSGTETQGDYRNQGGIVVGTVSSSADYQRLRDDSDNSVLPLVITPEEFSQLQGSNKSLLNRFIGELQAIDGTVVRMDLRTANNQVMEVFAVKNGSEISFIQPELQAARGPASVPSQSIQRENTLNDLQNITNRSLNGN